MLYSSTGHRAVAVLLALSLPLAARAQQPVFSQQQVESGKTLYRETCQMCHGSTLANGQFGTPLKGSYFQDKWKGKSLGELLTFVYEKMPPDNLKTLTPAQYTGAVAYILFRNDIAASETAMSSDKESLLTVILPW